MHATSAPLRIQIAEFHIISHSDCGEGQLQRIGHRSRTFVLVVHFLLVFWPSTLSEMISSKIADGRGGCGCSTECQKIMFYCFRDLNFTCKDRWCSTYVYVRNNAPSFGCTEICSRFSKLILLFLAISTLS